MEGQKLCCQGTINMTEEEFDVLDELYFVQPFEFLLNELEMAEAELKSVLVGLIERGWVKCFFSMQEEALSHELQMDTKYREYFYLATKEGLMAHNGR